ncbi:MAG: hypothetical protein JWM16_405, partial [Verrucomicrobiales bacterium]|nr:hypothetical protein [Verrucomicrobiales bacterium]
MVQGSQRPTAGQVMMMFRGREVAGFVSTFLHSARRIEAHKALF